MPNEKNLVRRERRDQLTRGWLWMNMVFLACTAHDATQLTPPCGSSSSSACAGAGGMGAVASNAGAVDAGVADAGLERVDAAPCNCGADCDAPDAYMAASGACELGSLASACGTTGCPALEQAVTESRSTATLYVLQRPCQSEDGRALITIWTSSGTFSSALVYAADSGELVAREVISDSAEYCDGRTPIGYYGSYIKACEVDPSLVPPLPDECYQLLPLNGRDAGVPDACVFVIGATDAGL